MDTDISIDDGMETIYCRSVDASTKHTLLFGFVFSLSMHVFDFHEFSFTSSIHNENKKDKKTKPFE